MINSFIKKESLAWAKKQLADSGFTARLDAVAAKIKLNPPTQQQLDAFSKAEDDCVCKHCGRCVLAGPPCCYQSVYDLWIKADSEMRWLRKIQSKKDKQINDLKDQIKALKGCE